MSTVLQSWVEEMPWKCQSILFSSLRGPDHQLLGFTKQVSKWMRSVCQQNADPSKPYIHNIHLPKVPEDVAMLWKELEHCPCHFVHHFLDGLAVIAYGHPDEEVARYAAWLHYDTAEELFHFVPESPATFLLRHRDKPGGADEKRAEWDKHAQAARECFLGQALDRFKVQAAGV